MSIQQPRRFVTTDQGHADVLNGPIDTLYANDQELAAQVENIKNDPAGNGVASKEALDNHASNTDLHVTAAKQALWSAAEGNAKQYTKDYAAPKAHTHPASDLPSASTQARGLCNLIHLQEAQLQIRQLRQVRLKQLMIERMKLTAGQTRLLRKPLI